MTGILLAAAAHALGVLLHPWFMDDQTSAPTADSQTYRLTNTGLVQSIGTTDGTVTVESWLDYAPNASLYEVRVTPTSGTFSSGSATGAWLGLGTTRDWTNTVPGPGTGTKTTIFTVEIRVAATGQVVATSLANTIQAQVA